MILSCFEEVAQYDVIFEVDRISQSLYLQFFCFQQDYYLDGQIDSTIIHLNHRPSDFWSGTTLSLL